ncbi:hypothetical protein TIFTF001_053235 [Ficus carica]|nr:hypothetical protein TIFTF001_053235 [Ficus carica]
MTIFGN